MDKDIIVSMLCRAVTAGDITLLRRLIRAGAPAHGSDWDGRTALHIAASEGNLAAVKVCACMHHVSAGHVRVLVGRCM